MVTRLIIMEFMQHPIRSIFICLLPIIIPVVILILLMQSVNVGSIGQLCNNAGNSGSDDESVGNISGSTSGEWTKSGTSANKLAKQTYQECVHYGMDAIHAAAATGNAAHESAGFTGGLKRPQIGGGGGQGLFQFTGQTPKYGWSPIGQVKSIMANGFGGIAEGHKWMKTGGSLADLTNSFEEKFERGGIPDNSRRDVMAKEVYKLFHGLGGASDSADTASSGASSSCNGSSSGDTSNDTDLLSFGKKYDGISYSLGNWSIAKKIASGASKSSVETGCDCDSFVWACLKHCGYKVGSPWGDCTGAMSALKKYEVSKGQTHAGTVGIYPSGRLQHAFFLEEKYHGSQTKILEEGPSNVNSDKTIGWSLTGGDFSTIKFYNVPK